MFPSQIHCLGIISHIFHAQLLFELVCHKAFIVVQVLLDVNLELDDIVQHAVDFRMQLFAQ